MSELKLEAGRYYKTRNGRKAKVECSLKTNTLSGFRIAQPFIGFIDDKLCLCSWCENGAWHDHGRESPNDLVAEWREPVTKEVMVYLLPYGNISLFPRDAIASARVTLNEGVFAK